MKSKLRPCGFHNACRQLYIDKLLYTYRKITDKTNVQVIVYQVSNTETKRYPGRRRVGWEGFDVFFFFDFFFCLIVAGEGGYYYGDCCQVNLRYPFKGFGRRFISCITIITPSKQPLEGKGGGLNSPKTWLATGCKKQRIFSPSSPQMTRSLRNGLTRHNQKERM